MNVKQLKNILAHMADDAEVFARDKDAIWLDQVHVVGVEKPTGDCGIAEFVSSIEDVYGGDEIELENESQQAIIFCDSD